MPAGTYNLHIDQGSDFGVSLAMREGDSPVDLTGYSARAQMRNTKASETVAASFTCAVVNPTLGQIQMNLSNSVSKDLAPGLYYYDLEIYTSGDAIVTRILEGKVTVDAEVTR